VKLLLIFIQGDETTWLEAAWDEQSASESPDEWQETIKDARYTAQQNGGEFRVATVEVEGVYGLFEVPELKGGRVERVEGER
jgi:hypothetical protein